MTARSFVLPLFYLFFSTMSLIMIWSLTPELLSKQLVAFLLGGVIILVISHLPLSVFFKHPKLWYSLIVVGLILPLLIPTTKSTQRWIDLPFFSIQPSQFAFLLVGLTLITLISKWGMNSWRHITKYAIVVLVPTVLIIIEPNLGTALLFLVVMGSLLFLAGLPIRYLLFCGALGFLVAWSGWNWWLKDYQKLRLSSFIFATEQTAATYNSKQALIAIGSGGLFGQGLGQGYQSQLKFLPEKQTDFIFASLAEEFGLFGSLLILSSYGALISFLIWGASFAQPKYRLFLLTTACLFLWQVTLHIGANVRLLPITGVPLPLLSYGGSSVLSFALMLGVGQRIILEIRADKKMYIA